MIEKEKSELPDRRWRASDDQILDALGEAIEQHGVGKIKMSQVADTVQISRVQLYNRFGSRDQLIWAFLSREAKRFNTFLSAKLENIEPIIEKIIQGIMFSVEATLQDNRIGSMVSVASNSELGSTREAQQQALDIVASLWMPILEPAIAARQIKTNLTARQVSDLIAITEYSLVNAAKGFGLSNEQAETYLRETLGKALTQDSDQSE